MWLINIAIIALPFASFALAVTCNIAREEAKSKTKEIIFGILTLFFGGLAFYLFFFTGILNNDNCAVTWSGVFCR